ncbi:olfactory receptor 52K2-like [Protopterus annectens]|uniref:olfactory receptor 52K2-like n=1 Tax=Protopterus annectens TaxID=7888 RepID=UPI001CFA84FA|nr:olfactory receptor 52K2-like [Protopterus annectens]
MVHKRSLKSTESFITAEVHSSSTAMFSVNHSEIQDTGLILNGFPGTQEIQYWISVPFTCMFITGLVGNLTVLITVVTEPSLHEPMYIFIAILAGVDLIPSVALLPKILALVWFGSNVIQFDSCFAQMFFIHFSAVMESSLLLFMAYDRYIAICQPLRYSSILTRTFIMKGILLLLARCLCFVLPIPILARQLPYCGTGPVRSAFCEYIAVLDSACVHTLITDNYLFILLAFVGIPDAALIGISYGRIVNAALNLKSKEARQKTFSTCSSHLFVILLFYITGSLSLLTYFSDKVPEHTRVLFSIMYIIVPPTLNPLIYGIKTKEILQRKLKILTMKRQTLEDRQWK